VHDKRRRSRARPGADPEEGPAADESAESEAETPARGPEMRRVVPGSAGIRILGPGEVGERPPPAPRPRAALPEVPQGGDEATPAAPPSPPAPPAPPSPSPSSKAETDVPPAEPGKSPAPASATRPTVHLSEESADRMRRVKQHGGEVLQPSNRPAPSGRPSLTEVASQERKSVAVPPRPAPERSSPRPAEERPSRGAAERPSPRRAAERSAPRKEVERPAPRPVVVAAPQGSGSVKGEEVRERVIEATYACVARWGISKTTVEDVGRKAGVSRATVYRYFPGGRDELVSSVITWEYGRFFRRLYDAVQDATSLEEVMERGLMFARRAIVEHEVLQRVLETEPELLLPNLTVEAHRTTGLIAEFLLPYLVVHGVTPGVNPEEAAEFLARMVLSYIASPGRWDLNDPDQVSELVRAELLAGMVRPAKPATPDSGASPGGGGGTGAPDR